MRLGVEVRPLGLKSLYGEPMRIRVSLKLQLRSCHYRCICGVDLSFLIELQRLLKLTIITIVQGVNGPINPL